MVVFTSCSKSGSDDPIPPTEKQFDVYVAGGVIGGSKTARYWKNGEPTDFAGTKNYPYSIYVSGTDVYLAGAGTDNALGYAKMWQNGKQTHLSDGTYSATATGIVVSGGNVYVSGYDKPDKTKMIATLWKNKMAIPLANGVNDTYAYGLYVQDNDVYVAGHEYKTGKNVAKIWKNNSVLFDLTNGSNNANANSVFVSGTDVYTAGYEYSGTKQVAKLWVNKTATRLSDGNNNAMSQATKTTV
jgi:hypothetical protein